MTVHFMPLRRLPDLVAEKEVYRWYHTCVNFQGLPYAGTQNGNKCVCGSALSIFGISTTCDTECTGDATQICGEEWLITVQLSPNGNILLPVKCFVFLNWHILIMSLTSLLRFPEKDHQ